MSDYFYFRTNQERNQGVPQEKIPSESNWLNAFFSWLASKTVANSLSMNTSPSSYNSSVQPNDHQRSSDGLQFHNARQGMVHAPIIAGRTSIRSDASSFLSHEFGDCLPKHQGRSSDCNMGVHCSEACKDFVGTTSLGTNASLDVDELNREVESQAYNFLMSQGTENINFSSVGEQNKDLKSQGYNLILPQRAETRKFISPDKRHSEAELRANNFLLPQRAETRKFLSYDKQNSEVELQANNFLLAQGTENKGHSSVPETHAFFYNQDNPELGKILEALSLSPKQYTQLNQNIVDNRSASSKSAFDPFNDVIQNTAPFYQEENILLGDLDVLYNLSNNLDSDQNVHKEDVSKFEEKECSCKNNIQSSTEDDFVGNLLSNNVPQINDYRMRDSCSVSNFEEENKLYDEIFSMMETDAHLGLLSKEVDDFSEHKSSGCDKKQNSFLCSSKSTSTRDFFPSCETPCVDLTIDPLVKIKKENPDLDYEEETRDMLLENVPDDEEQNNIAPKHPVQERAKKILKELFTVDKDIASVILKAIADSETTRGVTFSKILKYLSSKRKCLIDAKLRQTTKAFLNVAKMLNIIRMHCRRYQLYNPEKRLTVENSATKLKALKHKKSNLELGKRYKTSAADSKKYRNFHLKRCNKMGENVYKTLRSRKITLKMN